MALYTYRCPVCQHIKTVIHKVAETPYVRCDKCITVMVRALHPQNRTQKETNDTISRN